MNALCLVPLLHRSSNFNECSSTVDYWQRRCCPISTLETNRIRLQERSHGTEQVSDQVNKHGHVYVFLASLSLIPNLLEKRQTKKQKVCSHQTTSVTRQLGYAVY